MNNVFNSVNTYSRAVFPWKVLLRGLEFDLIIPYTASHWLRVEDCLVLVVTKQISSSHSCCWHSVWTEIAKKITSFFKLTKSLPKLILCNLKNVISISVFKFLLKWISGHKWTISDLFPSLLFSGLSCFRTLSPVPTGVDFPLLVFKRLFLSLKGAPNEVSFFSQLLQMHLLFHCWSPSCTLSHLPILV